MSRSDPYVEAMQREVENWPGMTYSLTTSSRHNRVWLTYGGRSRLATYPKTGSDRRGPLNHAADVRRALNDLGAQRARRHHHHQIDHRRTA